MKRLLFALLIGTATPALAWDRNGSDQRCAVDNCGGGGGWQGTTSVSPSISREEGNRRTGVSYAAAALLDYKAGNLDNAEEKYLSALAYFQPGSQEYIMTRHNLATIYNDEGVSASKRHEWSTCRSLYNKSLEMEPDNKIVLANLEKLGDPSSDNSDTFAPYGGHESGVPAMAP